MQFPHTDRKLGQYVELKSEHCQVLNPRNKYSDSLLFFKLYTFSCIIFDIYKLHVISCAHWFIRIITNHNTSKASTHQRLNDSSRALCFCRSVYSVNKLMQ